MRHVETITPPILPPVVRILVHRRYAPGRVVATVAFPERVSKGIGQTRSKPLRIAFLRLHLKRVIVRVRKAIEVSDVAQQPRLVTLPLAHVRLMAPTAVEVRIRRWSGRVEVRDRIIEMARLAADIPDSNDRCPWQFALDIEAPLPYAARSVVRRECEHIGTRRSRTLTR